MPIFLFQFRKLNNKIRKNATHLHQTQPPTFVNAARKRSPTSSTAIYHLPNTKSKWEDRVWRECHDQGNPRDIVEIKYFVAAIWRYRTIPCSYTRWPLHAQLIALQKLMTYMALPMSRTWPYRNFSIFQSTLMFQLSYKLACRSCQIVNSSLV